MSNETIQATFPKTEVQKCIIRQNRNNMIFVDYKGLKTITDNLKPIYTVST
ncbi:hypothetical protein HCH24_17405 [Enterococcus gallinarum]|nr:hypothetical protein [Enterococcus gallinarum]